MNIIAIWNQKGGVGKTTTTFHLARAAVLAKLRTLLIDADPQGNLTSVTTEGVDEDQVGLADVLSPMTHLPLADVIVPGIWPGLGVAPAPGQPLGFVRDQLVADGPGRERRLAKALDAIRDRYDLVLVDCPPDVNQLTVNATTAADQVVIVTQAKLFSLRNLVALLGEVEKVREAYNPRLRVAGAVVNLFEPRTVSGRSWLAELEANAPGLGLRLMSPIIPKRMIISDAIEAGQGLDQWPDKAAVGDLPNIYEQLLRQLLDWEEAA